MADLLEAYLKIDTCSFPVWLDNGRMIAFIANCCNQTQIHLMDIRDHSILHTVTVNAKITGLLSAAVDRMLFFCADTANRENEQIYQLQCGQETMEKPLIETPAAKCTLCSVLRQEERKLVYFSNQRSGRYFDLWLQNIATGESEILLQNDEAFLEPIYGGLSPQNNALLYLRSLSPSQKQLMLLELKDRTVHPTISDLTSARFDDAAWLADGRRFYVITDFEREYSHVRCYDTVTHQWEIVYSPQNDVTRLALSADNHYIAMVVNEGGWFTMHVMDAEKKEMIALPPLPGGVISYFDHIAFSPQGHQLLFSFSSSTMPENVWMLDLDNSDVRQLTFAGTDCLPSVSFAEPQLCSFVSHDGLTIPYWLYRPREMEDRPLPVIIRIHGGPEGQSIPYFEGWIQYLIQSGFAIADPNIRGSIGYGKTYEHLDDKALRHNVFQDIACLARHLYDTDTALPGKIALMGKSYGGYVALNCAVRYPSLWRCVVFQSGMNDLANFLRGTAPFRRAIREAEYGSLDTDEAVLRSLSPLGYLRQLKAPLLVLHGMNDTRVPAADIIRMVNQMIADGKEVQYCYFDKEGHTLRDPASIVHCYTLISVFLLQQMTKET